ncbi:MAG: hypothetical protein PHP08_00475 [Candidatus Dojkabacteria bacterium]|nr:hypothetical protein [Candidatus Dojkabacteria bacterium]
MVNNDAQISSEVIKFIFREYRKCLEHDRSKIRINGFTKGLLQASVRESTINSTAEYVSNMYDHDLKELLDGIENIMKKREKLAPLINRF